MVSSAEELVTTRVRDGFYHVLDGYRLRGEIERQGPRMTPKWVARAGGWETPVLRSKGLAKAALVEHIITQNGHVAPSSDDLGDQIDDRERFTYLAWEEVEDRLALTRGLVLDMLRRDEYAVSAEQRGALRTVASTLYAAHQAMRDLDERRGK